LRATVTDSVLYSGSDRTFINFTAPQQASLQLNLASHPGSTANFTWNSVDGATSYTLCITGAGGTCKTVSTVNANVTGLVPNTSYSATVTTNGVTSNTVTWSQ
jgi:cysteine synthase